ncbi:tautomerase family protein [Gymnodinialimonas sp. 2305UL16-5]|uniref:tautomerase family protein n=1 Tax=Gymnodinialimonas mytili TaxID=3126503 RepID=UPI0030A32845
MIDTRVSLSCVHQRNAWRLIFLPFNKLHVPQSLPAKTCRAINEELHESLVETCGVNPDDHFCLVARYHPDDILLHPTFLGERDPEATIVIEIALLDGRTDEQKEALFKDVRTRLDSIGFTAGNSIIFLLENNPIDWSFSPAGSVKSVLGL